MKSVDPKDFKKAGTVLKTHGFKGELRVQFFTKPIEQGWVFPEIRKKPVPFFMQSCKSAGNDQYIIQLREITTQEEAEALCGYSILQLKSTQANETPMDSFSWDDLIGYEMYTDGEEHFIGQVTGVQQQGKMMFLTLQLEDRILLVPAEESMITDINEEEQLIFVDLPEDFTEVF